jgi:hypothetical protein
VFVNPGATPITISCNNGQPIAGSAGEKLFRAGFACGDEPAGISILGGSTVPVTTGLRTYVNQDGQVLRPEQAINYSLGFSLAPTSFLQGLDIQATWYSIKIGGTLTGFGNPTTGLFNDPQRSFAHVVPSDMGCAQAADSAPTLCPQFEQVVANLLSDPRNPVGPNALTYVYWINDGGVFNKGWQRISGVDYQISYDFDAGDIGAFNTGIVGTYYLHRYSQTLPGADIVDSLHQDIAPLAGVEQLGVLNGLRSRYRARAGWANGPWTATVFMDYSGHSYHTQNAPPQVNNQCTTSGGVTPGGTFPCLINNYNNETPSFYTFDLSIGYDTGDAPVNDYLKNIGIQFVVQNAFDRHPPFMYRISTGGGNPAAFDITRSDQGRLWTILLNKTW